jgi:ABC-type glycerol-3-phosphate transport system permease component
VRLKLVLIASFLAALIGSGASIAIILGRLSSLKELSAPSLMLASTLMFPIVAAMLASFFVYRHTARRRKIQALLTALLAAFLSLAIFLFVSIFTSRAPRLQPQPTVPRNIG